jgi:uncharacterized OB-fold protein
LKNGEFKIPVCILCKNKIWPPSYYCPSCLSNKTIILRKVRANEFADSFIKDKEGVYGLVEISGIKIIGSFDFKDLKEGMKVRMSRCGINQDGTPFYVFAKA